MKDYVITKNFDNLGRIVIPKKMREHYGFTSCKVTQIIPTKDGVLLVPAKRKASKKQ